MSFQDLPIRLEYPKPSPKFLAQVEKKSQPCEVLEQPRLKLARSYFQDGIAGATEKTYLRQAVCESLLKALEQIPKNFGLIVFDAFRSRETQKGLFESFRTQIQKKNPGLSSQELEVETRKYVAHPDEPSRFDVPPHLSGGAIDLGLTDKNGDPLDMGTPFDDLTDRSKTDYFESPWDSNSEFSERHWETFRSRRRVLFHGMIRAGFVNWKHEWWHYDIGDAIWSQELQTPSIYDEMKI